VSESDRLNKQDLTSALGHKATFPGRSRMSLFTLESGHPGFMSRADFSPVLKSDHTLAAALPLSGARFLIWTTPVGEVQETTSAAL
jgi:hypothetical protein